MALVELELKMIFYLGLFLFATLYYMKDGLFKNILIHLYLPLSMIVVMMGIGTTYGTPLAFLLGTVMFAATWNALWWVFTVAYPDAKKQQKQKYLGGRRR